MDSLGVHDVPLHRSTQLLIRTLEYVPQRRLARAGGTDDDDADALRTRDVQLQNFFNLRGDVFVVLLLQNLLNRRLELGVADVAHLDAGVDVVE